jgi:outer membrane protein
MKTLLLVCVALVQTRAQTIAPARIAILNAQNALLSTKEGHRAWEEFEAKFAAKKADLEKRQAEIAALQDQLRKSGAIMSDDAQRRLAREIDKKTKALNHDAEDTQADYELEQGDITRDLERKFRAVVDKYAKDNGYTVVLDVSNPQTPAFWWANAADITNEVVRTYDAAYPLAAVKK